MQKHVQDTGLIPSTIQPSPNTWFPIPPTPTSKGLWVSKTTELEQHPQALILNCLVWWTIIDVSGLWPPEQCFGSYVPREKSHSKNRQILCISLKELAVLAMEFEYMQMFYLLDEIKSFIVFIVNIVLIAICSSVGISAFLQLLTLRCSARRYGTSWSSCACGSHQDSAW